MLRSVGAYSYLKPKMASYTGGRMRRANKSITEVFEYQRFSKI
jgi:hypothetical protein